MSNDLPPDLIVKWAEEAGFVVRGSHIYDSNGNGYPMNRWLTAFAAKVEQHVLADEREACAKVLEGEHMWLNAAAAIRARKP